MPKNKSKRICVYVLYGRTFSNFIEKHWISPKTLLKEYQFSSNVSKYNSNKNPKGGTYLAGKNIPKCIWQK